MNKLISLLKIIKYLTKETLSRKGVINLPTAENNYKYDKNCVSQNAL